jgi:hypothetical protein
MGMPSVTVRRSGDRWGVTQNGAGWFLAEFTLWQDAIDYARSLAVAQQNSVLEGEDSEGRVALRQIFWTDASGLVRVRTGRTVISSVRVSPEGMVFAAQMPAGKCQEDRACHARDETRQAEGRPLGEAGEKPQAGNRNWASRGASGREVSAQRETQRLLEDHPVVEGRESMCPGGSLSDRSGYLWARCPHLRRR